MKQGLKAVIFDMDGVILDSERALMDEWEEVARERGLADILEVYVRVCGTTRKTTEEIMKEAYGQDFPFDELDRHVYAMRDKKYANGLPLKSGIRELLTALKEAGIPTALATSTHGKRARAQLEAVGLLPFFQVVVTGEMVTHSKPDPEIFLKAMELLGVSPESAVVIEDSFNGVRAGRRSGAEVLMVPDLKQPTEEIRENYDHLFPSLHEVREYLLG